MNILKDKKFWLQLLWLAAVTVPWGIGGFLVHKAQTLMMGLAAYWLLGLLVPLVYFLVQQKGYGSEWGSWRAAAHGPVWISLSILQLVIFWNYLPVIDGGFKENPAGVGAFVFAILLFFVAAALFLDYGLCHVYEKLAEKKPLYKLWAGTMFFSGLIPGTAIVSFLGLYYAGGMRLDAFTAGLFLLEIFSYVFYGKIFLGMVTFGTYVFAAQDGRKGKRLTLAAFSGIFWLMLLYVPFVISVNLPGNPSWRAYLDPSYLSVVPLVSDLWLCGLALLAGKQVTEWIFKD